MNKLEPDYRERLKKEYDKYVYELAVAEINKTETKDLIKYVTSLSKQIAVLDVEIMIARLKDYDKQKTR